jgi:hypothetical protein
MAILQRASEAILIALAQAAKSARRH